METLVQRIRAGLTPRDLLEALTIAACQEVSPYPEVGFKYHAVMVLQSTYLSVAAFTGDHVWLPLLWTADYFKEAAEREDRSRAWSLPATPEYGAGTGGVPALTEALLAWDPEAADHATAALVTNGQADAALQTLMHYAARDFRSIGHKTIAAANAHRLHALLGAPVTAPLARSLALAIQNPEGDSNPARHVHEADADWKANETLADTLPPDWERGPTDAAAGRTLLEELRTGVSQSAVAAAVDLLSRGVSARTVWEAVMALAAELILRNNGILAVHANTTANAMHYSYRVSGSDRTMRLLLLQAVAFMARFRSLVDSRRRVHDRRLDAIEPLPAHSVEEIFTTLGQDRYRGVQQALGWLVAGHDSGALAGMARWHATLKNAGTHDLKFTEASIENYEWLRPPWRNAVLAASLMYANATSAPDDDVVAHAQRLLRSS